MHIIFLFFVCSYTYSFCYFIVGKQLTALFAVMMQEDGISLMTVIKGTFKYRCARRLDITSDFLPPSMTEFKYLSDQITK